MAEKLKVICCTDLDAFNEQANQLLDEGYDMNHDFNVSALPTLTGKQELHYAATFLKYQRQNEQATLANDEDDGLSNGPTPFDEAIDEAIGHIRTHHKGQKAIWAGKLTELINQRESWRYAMRDNPDVARHLFPA